MFKTRKQIAKEYGICVRTLNKNLLKKGIRLKSGDISPADQEMIYLNLGKKPLNNLSGNKTKR